MNEHTHTLPRVVGAPDVADTANPPEVVVIGVAEVMLATAAATMNADRPAVHPLRDWWTRHAVLRAERRRMARRRPDYVEAAAMAREMHRL